MRKFSNSHVDKKTAPKEKLIYSVFLKISQNS